MTKEIKVKIGHVAGFGLSVKDAERCVAQNALHLLSDRDRVGIALEALLGIQDEKAAGMLVFAANRLTEHAAILERNGDQRRCG